MRWKVTLSYNGAKYLGWQRQIHGPSIQSTVESVLNAMHPEPVTIHGSGRTDRGVHARAQVFHFDSMLNLDASRWERAFNSMLPRDIHVTKVEAVTEAFHARLSARAKTYEYRIECGPYNVFEAETTYQYNSPLNEGALKQALSCFEGTHDFTSFCANPLDLKPNQVRTIYRTELEKRDSQYCLTFIGSGFLRYMVRRMVIAVVEVGSGEWPVERVKEIMAAKDKQALGLTIDGCGLYLDQVFYTQEELDRVLGSTQ